MSRRTEIQEAGKYVGLSAAHWVCYGEGWREVGDYRGRVEEILGDITLNEDEFTECCAAAVKRAAAYIARAYATPGKTLIPEDEKTALMLAGQDIQAILAPYHP